MPIDALTSILFVPGIRPPMFDKAKTVPASAICLDLEDSVAAGDKTKARLLVAGAIGEMAAAVETLLVRVNGADTGLLEDDLAAVVAPGLAGISLPKVESQLDILRADHYLTFLEKTRNIPVGTIRLMPWIESARGIHDCVAILSASPRVIAASFGAEDYTVDLGVVRSRGSVAIAHARAQIAIACKAAGVAALDTPDPEYRDTDWLIEDCRFSREVGFAGRFCIHPAQVPIVNTAYRPTDAEIDHARAIIAAYDEGVAQGLGAIGLNGVMIDMPVVERARRLLARASV